MSKENKQITNTCGGSNEGKKDNVEEFDSDASSRVSEEFTEERGLENCTNAEFLQSKLLRRLTNDTENRIIPTKMTAPAQEVGTHNSSMVTTVNNTPAHENDSHSNSSLPTMMNTQTQESGTRNSSLPSMMTAPAQEVGTHNGSMETTVNNTPAQENESHNNSSLPTMMNTKTQESVTRNSSLPTIMNTSGNENETLDSSLLDTQVHGRGMHISGIPAMLITPAQGNETRNSSIPTMDDTPAQENETCSKTDDSGGEVSYPKIKQNVPRKDICGVCRVRLGLCAIRCRCGNFYCAKHRYDKDHDCSFDYRALGTREIEKNNPRVVSQKVQKL